MYGLVSLLLGNEDDDHCTNANDSNSDDDPNDGVHTLGGIIGLVVCIGTFVLGGSLHRVAGIRAGNGGGMRCGHKRMLTSGSSAAAAAARTVGGAVVV